MYIIINNYSTVCVYVCDNETAKRAERTATLDWQEAQLSQRGRAMLRVIEYFAKSLKITHRHSKWRCWEGRNSVLAFRCKTSSYLVPFRRY